MDILGVLEVRLITIVFAFLFVDLFDMMAGITVGLANRAGMLDAQGCLPRLRQALLADGIAAILGAMMGASITTSYIESAAGINAGGRTVLTAVTVGAVFFLYMFVAPLAAAISPYATALALLFVAWLTVHGLAEIDWEDPIESAPAVATAVSMRLTLSIATGTGLGVISYFAVIKVLAGRAREASIDVIVLAIASAVKLVVI